MEYEDWNILRFHLRKTMNVADEYKTEIILNPRKTYQTIEGFGGAVTDAVGINWLKLTKPLQDTFVE